MQSNLDQKPKCPNCKKAAGLEIIYDAPKEEDIVKLSQGLAVPGGFKPKSGPAFKWNCGRCGHLWVKVKKINMSGIDFRCDAVIAV